MLLDVMKKTIVIIAAALLICGVAYGQESQRLRLEKHLYTLASDSLRGREAGTDDGRKAADYISRQWQQMGLKPMWGDSYSCPFNLSNGGMEQYMAKPGSMFNNLVAVIEGSDPVLKNEYIVVGAHYDHVGVMGGQIYNGADDNASGSSCVLEMARQLLAHQKELKRSVIICAFDAEEKGLFGSKDMVKVLKRYEMLDRVKLMLSVDMVGWYKANGELVLEGTGTLAKAKSWLKPEQLGKDLKVRFKSFENSMFTATDTEPFAEKGIPTLAITTGLKSPYHKPEDDADLIDYEGLDRITDYLVALTVSASRHEGKIASGRVAAKHRTPHFEAGLIAGFNHCHLEFPEATIRGKHQYGFQGGLTMQYNFSRYFALRANVLYDYSHCPLPASSNAFGKGYHMEQHSLLVPVTVQLGIREMGTGLYVGLGGYYGRVFGGSFYGNVPTTEPTYDAKPNQFGFTCNFGVRLGGHWQIDGTWYYLIGDLFNTAGGLPEARKHTYAVTLGYIF